MDAQKICKPKSKLKQTRRRTLGSSILERIGNTPLLRLDRLTSHLPGITLLGKAEWVKPGGLGQGSSGLGDCGRG